LLLAFGGYLPLQPHANYVLRTVVVALVWLAFSRSLVTFRVSHPWTSLLVGLAVFLLWIAPDVLWPGYRESWLFRNPLTGAPPSALSPDIPASAWFLFFRIGGSVFLVPVVEELFWRAWLMRRLISADFQSLPLGAYSPRAFWITALLFASEHGPYWDVGLLAGIVYNGWLVRTRNLADCILAHAVTNACLAAYVLLAGAWQYWL
jgi:CAAX prenyl protease-like protein